MQSWRVILSVVLLAGCASTPKPPLVPEWTAIPPGVVEVFCKRLQAEGIASGAPVAIVRTTQPLATPQTAVAIVKSGRHRPASEEMANALRLGQRSMPITIAGSCEWNAIDVRQRRADQMTVEMSAPMPNPFHPGTAGVFVRLSLAGEHASWYWISLVPHPAGWTVGSIHALAL